jgi:dephospho-CoA kinase
MIIGLTGGVGGGKSTVLNILHEKYKAHILEADKIAKDLMSPGKVCFDKIIREFGEETKSADGELDRKKLADIVFKDDNKLKKLNNIVHPEVKNEISSQIKSIMAKDKNAIIVIEAALLIEAGYRDICDKFWYVYSDYPVRKQRLMDSRGYTEKKIEEIVNNQLTEEEFKNMCDYVIDNSNDFENTLQQIKNIIGS